MNFDSVKFAMDNEGYNIYDMLEKAYQQGIDDFLEKICEKFTEYERKGWVQHYCVNIKNKCAEIADDMKEQKDE